ncbi:MAG: alpha-ketoacid dehydrogenase subunit beta [Candidatus Thermoplasmatota archaeon]|nr:alpha-ketoacid dehydrogenase subunit beta [Candidatus Sysuiplasma jiujiangense]MBX8639171.1 alpha-ketoacid dehydrogenase subunit beta [Candidatus Sysuiplasma jiujiangense]MBX8642200.1 alpha-ketoacid dehydrogenase subunit beta [Candidatus Sysuiplasma jiujiangense]MCL4317835.1 alpha-ketoacid dehydrogenase subunit beta [Candidatus Thermoplasmatota archaeon]MCL5254263.1 alpha-ketoacid dehydrogenase subunit beta [Candidatus Thermoplasmatota archaeon]
MTSETLLQAVTDAMRTEMDRDEDVVVLGEDVGRDGGVFRATEGLLKQFGPSRVMDTPLNESGILGVAAGMAMYGLRPVAEIQFMDFIYPGFDQIVSEISKIRYRSGGTFSVPMVIRTPYGGGIKGGLYHSQSTEAFFTHLPGLKVVTPATPYDAKGLLIASIRDPDPVLFLEPKKIYRSFKEEVPEGDYTVDIGKAKISRKGSDVTIVSYGASLHASLQAAALAEKEGISVEVIDLRTLVPVDVQTVVESVRRTGRLIIVNEATKFSSFAAEISALVAERAIDSLSAPIFRVSGFDTPFNYTWESIYLPDTERILEYIRKSAGY